MSKCEESYIKYMDSCLQQCLENSERGFTTHDRSYTIQRDIKAWDCPNLSELHKKHFKDYVQIKKSSNTPLKLTNKIHYIKVEKIDE